MNICSQLSTAKDGLEEIKLIAGKRETDFNPEYCLDSKNNKAYVRLYLKDFSHTGLPLLSRLFVNMSIMLSIEDHYKEYLSKKFRDDPIFHSRFNVMNVMYSWGDLGIWKPVFLLYWKIRGYKSYRHSISTTDDN